MAQNPDAYNNLSAYMEGGGGAERPFDYQRYLALFKANFHIIATFFVMAITLAFISVAKIPDRYQATTQLIVERPEANTRNSDDTQATVSESFKDEYYNTQIEIIKSNAVLKQVVDDLRLADYFETDSEEDALGRLRGMVSIKRIGDSRLFAITVQASNAKFVADVANAVANSFVRKNFEDLLYYSKELLSWLPEKNGTGEAGKENIVIKDPLGTYRQMSREELIESLPSIRTDATLNKLREKRRDSMAELELLLKQYKAKHPRVIKAQTNLKYLDENISAEKNRIIEGLKTKASGTLQTSMVRIIEQATPPKGPLPASRMRVVVMAGIIELLLSLAVLFMMDFFDPTIHVMEDFERKGIMLPFLGPIPLVKKKLRDEGQRAILGYYEKNSDVSEGFRYLRVAINFSATPEALRNLVITSCLPHEGKSFVSDNLAVSFAQDGNRTLLVDADLRRPTLHRVFKVENKVGLSSYLTSQIEFSSIVRETFVENMHIVTSGPVSPNPGAILGSDRMKLFLAEARKQYDRVIIDCPPLTGIGDGLVIGNLVGHLILVVGSKKTPADLILHIQQQIEKARVKIIGMILNMVDIERERYHGYSKYYYKTYNRYYSKENQE